MRYDGGKGRCFQRIINLMPPHRLYIEPFVGGGAVLRHKRSAEKSIGIDLDAEAIQRLEQLQFEGSVHLVCTDALDYLASNTFDAQTLIYADPPYLPSTRRRPRVYRHEMTEDDHQRLLTILSKQPCFVIISGYPSRLYDNMLSSWWTTTFQGTSHIGRRVEIAWTNYEPTARLHDYRYLGDTFRERERVRRLVDRWRRRLSALPSPEREAVLHALGDPASAPTKHPFTHREASSRESVAP